MMLNQPAYDHKVASFPQDPSPPASPTCLPPNTNSLSVVPPAFLQDSSIAVWKLPKVVFAQYVFFFKFLSFPPFYSMIYLFYLYCRYLCAFGLEIGHSGGVPLVLVDLERPPTTPAQSTSLTYNLVYQFDPSPFSPSQDAPFPGQEFLQLGEEGGSFGPSSIKVQPNESHQQQQQHQPSPAECDKLFRRLTLRVTTEPLDGAPGEVPLY